MGYDNAMNTVFESIFLQLINPCIMIYTSDMVQSNLFGKHSHTFPILQIQIECRVYYNFPDVFTRSDDFSFQSSCLQNENKLFFIDQNHCLTRGECLK